MTTHRENNARPKKPIHDQFNFQPEHLGSLGIPPEEIPDGMDYLWVVESVNDKPDHSHVVKAMRKGWISVPSDRHPELTPWIGLGGAYKDMDRSAIRIGGLILMERAKQLGIEERRRANEKYNQEVRQAKELNQGLDDPYHMRTFINEESRDVY